MKIPHNQILTLEQAAQTEVGKLLIEKGLIQKYGKVIMFCVYFLLEWGKDPDDQEFDPYVDLLPKDVSQFPAMFTEKELLYLEGSGL